MTSAQLIHPVHPRTRRDRRRGDQARVAGSPPRRTQLASEAVVARYIRDLAIGRRGQVVGERR